MHRTPRSIFTPVGFWSGAWRPPLVRSFIPVVAVVLVIENTEQEKADGEDDDIQEKERAAHQREDGTRECQPVAAVFDEEERGPDLASGEVQEYSADADGDDSCIEARFLETLEDRFGILLHLVLLYAIYGSRIPINYEATEDNL